MTSHLVTIVTDYHETSLDRADLSPSNLECFTIEITNPTPSFSLCTPGTDHHNHLLTSFQPLRELLTKLPLKTWSYILWVT